MARCRAFQTGVSSFASYRIAIALHILIFASLCTSSYSGCDPDLECVLVDRAADQTFCEIGGDLQLAICERESVRFTIP